MNKPSVSMLVYTARRDYPFVGRPELHCYDLITASLAQQTFTDFELVVVDALWEQRPDWFANHPQPYRVKHVPASPNRWHQLGRPGLVNQLNRGLAWCDGELVFIGSESCIWPPHFMQLAWDLYSQRGSIPVAWYAVLWPEPPPRGDHDWFPKPPLSFMGYCSENMWDCDHRAKRFVEDPNLIVSQCHHQHYFAYASLPMSVALELNGFDEAFDGDLHLLDVDFGSRLEMSGRGGSIAMHRGLWCMEARADDHWMSGISRGPLLKCGYAQWEYNRLARRIRANTPLPDGWVNVVKEKVCGGSCPLRESCAAESRKEQPGGEGVVYPFCSGPQHELTDKWLSQIPVFELSDEINNRHLGAPPYDRGYVHGY